MTNSWPTTTSRRAFLKTCGAAGLGAMLAPWWARAGATGGKRPNVMILLADDSGFSDLGCYGGEIETPNLDRLAGNGLRFPQMYVTGRCWPTRACLLTGYYYEQTTSRNFPSWVRTLPERMNTAGYRCFHTGKWHVQRSPKESGFLPDSDIPKAPAGASAPTDGEENFGYPKSESITSAALNFLDDHANNHAEQPFLLNVAYYAPHFPVMALPKDIERFKGRYDAGWDAVRKKRWERQREMGIVNCELSPMDARLMNKPIGHQSWEELEEKFGPGEVTDTVPWDTLTAEQKKFQAMKMEIHAAMVYRMDREIGRLVDKLKAMGAFDNTLIVFLSDNGASPEIMIRGNGHDPSARPGSQETHLCIGPAWATACNTPFRYYKMWTHEGGISSPGIVHWPKGIKARGELRHAPVHCIDVVATCYELAGLPPQDPAAGGPPSPARSLVPAFNQDRSSLHEELFFEHNGRAYRTGDFKISCVSKSANAWTLHDLSVDRGEQKDLSDTLPEKKQAMIARWEQLKSEFTAQSQQPESKANTSAGKPGGNKSPKHKQKKK